MMGQVFGWLLLKVSDSAEHMLIRDYRMTFGLLLFGVALAIFTAFFLKETGHGRKNSPAASSGVSR